MRRPDPVQEQIQRREEAAKCFVRAAALLGELPTEDITGEALFWAGLGMVRLAQSDPDARSLGRAEEIVAACRERGRQREEAAAKPE